MRCDFLGCGTQRSIWRLCRRTRHRSCPGSTSRIGVGMALLALGYATYERRLRRAVRCPGADARRHALFKTQHAGLIGSLYRPRSTTDAAQITFYLILNAGGTIGALTAGLLLRGRDFRILCAGRRCRDAGRADDSPAWKNIPASASPEHASDRRLDASRTSVRPAQPRARADRRNDARHAGLHRRFWSGRRLCCSCGRRIAPTACWAASRFLPRGSSVCRRSWCCCSLRRSLRCCPDSAPDQHVPYGRRRRCGIGAAFAVLVPPALWTDGHRVSMLWLIARMTLLTLASYRRPAWPVADPAADPARFVGVVVGSWYVAGALGYWLSGELGAGFVK